MNITYTLLADGSSDRTLMPIINWTLNQIHDIRFVPQFAELVPKPALGLQQRASETLKVYQCDLIFIHRDAENSELENRIQEIRGALETVATPFVPIVPIRMTEAWLLIDEQAIRNAASNENGRTPLNLPLLKNLENIPDPKSVLFDRLRLASELPPRRLKKFHADGKRHRVSELIKDFSLLRELSAFKQFEKDLEECIEVMRSKRIKTS
jgi:hypothetical protein